VRTEDGALVYKCLNGEPEMFCILVDKYKASIYALVYNRLRNFHDAEDVTQEVFLQAFKNLRKLKNWDNFAIWLSSIASNLSKRWIRSNFRRPDREFIEDKDLKTIEEPPIESYQDSEISESLREALDSLPEIYQQVLTLHYLGGMSGMEIARTLGISHDTVRQRLSRARAQLREEMIAMMSRTFQQQKLSASFTFRIVELVKKIKINPVTETKNLPWGLSLGAGLIFAILMFGQHIQINLPDIAMGLPLPSEMKVLKVGEIPVDAVKVSTIASIGNKKDGKGVAPDPKGQDNAFFMAPQDEGGKWERRKDIPSATRGASSAEIEGKIFIIGGKPNGSINQMYDTTLDSWEQKANMPAFRCNHTTTVYNGKIYAIGGQDLNFNCFSEVYEYDPINDKWQQKANMPSPKSFHSAVVYNNKIYVFGGENPEGVLSLSIYVYDPAINQWDQLKDIPEEFFMDGSVAINYKDKIYFFGGQDANGGWLSHVSIFDPLKESWKWTKDKIPTQRYVPAAGIINNKVYLIGGFNQGWVTLSEVEEYDIDLDRWTTKTEMPSTRGNFGSQVPAVNGKIYVIGGQSVGGDNPLSTNEVYTPDTIESKGVDPSGKLPKTWGMLKAK